MEFEPTPKVAALCARLRAFMDQHVHPVEREYAAWFEAAGNRWTTPPLMRALQARARAEGLWNLFLPDAERGAGLTQLEYAPLAEIMGRTLWAAEVFNCSAPDSGNMETLQLYGTGAQQERWLKPLLAGEIRSGFAMTEPDVASSDATNIACSIRRDGDAYVINGRKWFTTGAMRDNCAVVIVLGVTDPDHSDAHARQSMILVPRDAPGVRILRHVETLGYDGAPLGEPEIAFDGVRVPTASILLGEGRGFEIAQGRLGPGRLHHCMRLIGGAQRALELMLDRVGNRTTFGSKLSENQSVREDLARSWCEIEQARLLGLKAAATMDQSGNRAARELIYAIKIVAPTMAQNVIDRAMQIHGGKGLTGDLPLAELFNYARQLRIADGPDQVHMMALGRSLVKAWQRDVNPGP